MFHQENVVFYLSCDDGSYVKQTFSDTNLNSNVGSMSSAIASVNGALDATLPGGGWFADVWYKDRDYSGNTDTKITGIACIQEEVITRTDVYGTAPST